MMCISRRFLPVTSGLSLFSRVRGHKDVRTDGSGPPRRKSRQSNGLAFDVGEALQCLLGKDLTRIDGIGPYLALKLVSECGDDLSAWPSAEHFTSWLCLAPVTRYQVARFYRREQDGREAAPRRFCDWPPWPLGAPRPRWVRFTGGSPPASARRKPSPR